MPRDKMDPRVSVALCTHDGAEYVLHQVESILAQSRPVDEIVLSDDASSDETVEIVRRAVASHSGTGTPKLTVLANKTALGVVGNFEQAIRAASGDLIALSDQDDVWHPDRLRTIVDVFLASDDVDLVFSDARLVDGDGNPLAHSLFEALSMTDRERSLMRTGRAFDALLGRNLVTGATAVFRRSLVEHAVPFAPDWVHDEWLAMLASATGTVRMLEDELIDYRQHDNNQIGAARLTFTQKVARVAEPRTARNLRLLNRSAQLVTRLDQLSAVVPASKLATARGKARHEAMRSALPAARLRRIPAIARELLSGRYRRYGRGILDAGRDLLQPVG